MRLLFIGDIVGKPGRGIVTSRLRTIREKHSLDFVVANAENAAGGSGLTSVFFRELIDAGIDCITLGDHAFRQKEIMAVLDSDERIIRPGNYPPEAPGKGYTVLRLADGTAIAVFALLGRVYMPPVDCPFHAAGRILETIHEQVPDCRITLLDFHAEATSDKQLMGRMFDGRISAVLGTHTHVPTADECLFPGGTAFQCDVGMTGPFESILGRRIDRVMENVTTLRPTKYDVACNDVRLCGTIVDIDSRTGHAVRIERLVVKSEPVS